jgi:hypothetical protein
MCSSELNHKKISIIEYPNCIVSDETYTSGFNLIYNNVKLNDNTLNIIKAKINNIDVFKNVPFIGYCQNIITIETEADKCDDDLHEFKDIGNGVFLNSKTNETFYEANDLDEDEDLF